MNNTEEDLLIQHLRMMSLTDDIVEKLAKLLEVMSNRDARPSEAASAVHDLKDALQKYANERYVR